MKTRVDPKSYIYRILREKCPNEMVFYEDYFSGSYYDHACTTYTDSDGKKVHEVIHSWYG